MLALAVMAMFIGFAMLVFCAVLNSDGAPADRFMAAASRWLRKLEPTFPLLGPEVPWHPAGAGEDTSVEELVESLGGRACDPAKFDSEGKWR